MLASMEYATKHAGAKLILIMGHTHCSAIKAVCQGNLSGNLLSLAHAINPAVQAIQKKHPSQQLDCNGDNTTTAIAIQNVRNMISRVIDKSNIIRSLLENGTIKIVGDLHDLDSW